MRIEAAIHLQGIEEAREKGGDPVLVPGMIAGWFYPYNINPDELAGRVVLYTPEVRERVTVSRLYEAAGVLNKERATFVQVATALAEGARSVELRPRREIKTKPRKRKAKKS